MLIPQVQFMVKLLVLFMEILAFLNDGSIS